MAERDMVPYYDDRAGKLRPSIIHFSRFEQARSGMSERSGGRGRVFAIPEPLEVEALFAEASVEALVGAVLPGFSWVDVSAVDLLTYEPAQHGARHELRSIVGAEHAWGAVNAHELREDLDDAVGANAAGLTVGRSRRRRAR